MVRKMSKFDPQALEHAFYGESNRRGIYMRLEQSEEHLEKDCREVLVMRFPGAYACITQNGNVEVNPENVEEIWKEEREKDESDASKIIKVQKLFFALAGIALILMFVTLFSNNAHLPSLCMSIYWICFGISIMMPILFADMQVLGGNKEILQLFRFHAAEHAAINAYYDLKRIPTMEEIKKYSIYSYRCGITRVAKYAWVPIGVGICRLVPGDWFFLTTGIFVLITMWAVKKNFYFVEALYTAEPTEFEYDAAIKAMTLAVLAKEEVEANMREVLNNSPNIKVTMDMFEDENGNKGPMFCFQIGNPDDLEDE